MVSVSNTCKCIVSAVFFISSKFGHGLTKYGQNLGRTSTEICVMYCDIFGGNVFENNLTYTYVLEKKNHF